MAAQRLTPDSAEENFVIEWDRGGSLGLGVFSLGGADLPGSDLNKKPFLKHC